MVSEMLAHHRALLQYPYRTPDRLLGSFIECLEERLSGEAVPCVTPEEEYTLILEPQQCTVTLGTIYQLRITDLQDTA